MSEQQGGPVGGPQEPPFLIDIEEYMRRMGAALTAYTQVFGAVVTMTLDTKVKVGLLTPELAAALKQSIGDNLMAYLAKVEERMKAKAANPHQSQPASVPNEFDDRQDMDYRHSALPRDR